MHWPGIEPGSPAWEARILPLNHQCHYREHICMDSPDVDLFRSFSSAGHSCPVLVGRSRLSSSALSCTGCPLPSGLLRVALGGTQVGFGSVWVVEQPGARAHWPNLVQNSLRPLGLWPTRLLCPWDFHAPLLETHRGSTAAPLALAWLSAPCREHKVFCQDTEVKNPSLWLEDERTRWEMLQREGNILKSFPELLCGCCRLGGCPMTIMLSLVFWPWCSPRSSLNSSTEAQCAFPHICHCASLQGEFWTTFSISVNSIHVGLFFSFFFLPVTLFCWNVTQEYKKGLALDKLVLSMLQTRITFKLIMRMNLKYTYTPENSNIWCIII